jgi:hypothetical protein
MRAGAVAIIMATVGLGLQACTNCSGQAPAPPSKQEPSTATVPFVQPPRLPTKVHRAIPGLLRLPEGGALAGDAGEGEGI